jgi:serine/threonine protein kinase
MAEKIMRTIGQYSIIRPIGSGGMATVYEAVDEKLGRSAAVKILHPHLASDTSSVERFKREALSAAKLVHPNIVQVYDYIEQDGDKCIALEFVPGTDAESVVKRSGGLGFKNTLAIMHPVAEALKIAHQHGMIHRDVKPSNIMIRLDRRVMLTDFGLVKGMLDTTLTMDNAIAGTPAFMGPEQISGKRLLPSADVYAWAVSFHFILTGSLPYETSEFLSLVSDIKAGKIVIDKKALSAMPGKYAGLIRRCLLTNPADRPKNASELLDILGTVPADISLDHSICNPEHIDKDVSLYATERSIAKSSKSHVIIYTLILLAVFILSLFLFNKSDEKPINPIVNSNKAEIVLTPVDTLRKEKQRLSVKTKPSQIKKTSIANSVSDIKPDTLPTSKAEQPAVVIPDSGAIFVFSDPWTNVEINGTSLGKTPFGPTPIPVGTYKIRLYNEFTEEINDTITIVTGEITRKRYRPSIKPAYRK